MAAIHRVPEAFIASTMSFVANMANTRHLVFFWLDSRMSAVDCKMVNISRECQEFMGRLESCDPLAPRVMADADQAVGCLSAGPQLSPREDPGSYRSFLERHRFVDELGLMLRCRGEFVAGISAFRHADETEDRGPPNFSMVAPLLEKSLPYIEFNLTRHLGADKEAIRTEIIDRYGLTRRESEIAELIGAGCTNSDIAQCLDLGLATVKTHIVNLFRKVGVENRSSLVALLPR